MKRVLVLFVVGVVLFGAISVQNANAQNANIGQRIIGTWVDHEGTTWVFNANGNFTRTDTSGLTFENKFAVIDAQLVYSFNYVSNGTNYVGLTVFSISISSDGRTLILTHMVQGTINGIWLTKR